MTDQPIETESVANVTDISNKLGLQVGSPEASETAEEVSPEDAERAKVLDVQKVLGEQNHALLGQLKLVGKMPTPLMLLKLEHDVLLDFVFGEDGVSREAYTTACHMQLNGELKRALGQHFGVPEDAPDVTEPSE